MLLGTNKGNKVLFGCGCRGKEHVRKGQVREAAQRDPSPGLTLSLPLLSRSVYSSPWAEG